MNLEASNIRLALVGPLPPPSGGMANQTLQLGRLLREEGMQVEMVQTNAPYRPAWVGRIRGARALFRLLPYLLGLWRAAGRAQILHIMANSGWSWHLFVAPAVWIGWLRGSAMVINYRGGEAETFFSHSFIWVKPSLQRASAIIVPSGFLQAVFARYRVPVQVVPNIIDLSRFTATWQPRGSAAPHLIVTRNLEPIYDIPTALRAFQRVLAVFPQARLSIAGSGPMQAELIRLTAELGLSAAVSFTGRLDNERIATLYHGADLMLNPSLADNMPISVLEALACGVPVVSTKVGGIPFLLEHGRTALLVPPGEDQPMAEAALRLLMDIELAQALSAAGIATVRQFTWPRVREQLFTVYNSVLLS